MYMFVYVYVCICLCISGVGELVTCRNMPLGIMVQTKSCPKCYYPIEKNGGCQRMSCSRCNTPFCWHCGKTYEYYDGYYHDACQPAASEVSCRYFLFVSACVL